MKLRSVEWQLTLNTWVSAHCYWCILLDLKFWLDNLKEYTNNSECSFNCCLLNTAYELQRVNVKSKQQPKWKLNPDPHTGNSVLTQSADLWKVGCGSKIYLFHRPFFTNQSAFDVRPLLPIWGSLIKYFTRTSSFHWSSSEFVHFRNFQPVFIRSEDRFCILKRNENYKSERIY